MLVAQHFGRQCWPSSHAIEEGQHCQPKCHVINMCYCIPLSIFLLMISKIIHQTHYGCNVHKVHNNSRTLCTSGLLNATTRTTDVLDWYTQSRWIRLQRSSGLGNPWVPQLEMNPNTSWAELNLGWHSSPMWTIVLNCSTISHDHSNWKSQPKIGSDLGRANPKLTENQKWPKQALS